MQNNSETCSSDFDGGGRYRYSRGERVTLIEEIPEKFQKIVPLPGGGKQVVDTRICYTFHPEHKTKECPNGSFLECVNLAMDEDR